MIPSNIQPFVEHVSIKPAENKQFMWNHSAHTPTRTNIQSLETFQFTKFSSWCLCTKSASSTLHYYSEKQYLLYLCALLRLARASILYFMNGNSICLNIPYTSCIAIYLLHLAPFCCSPNKLISRLHRIHIIFEWKKKKQAKFFSDQQWKLSPLQRHMP